MDPDFFVWDCRSHNTIGPYSEENAKGLVESLNVADLAHETPALAGLGIKPKGPYYVKTEAERNRLRSLGMTKGNCK